MNKWLLLAFLCLIFVVYTVDRALLGILALPIQQDTGISNVRFGVLSAGIFWTYAICVPFSGLIGDRYNRMLIIGLAALAWSVMTVLAGFSTGFWSLFLLVSVAIVIPQTLYGPSANALIASCHGDTRTVAMSCHQGAYFVGWFISGMTVTAIVSKFGSWRAAFLVFGIVGILLGGWFLVVGCRAGRLLREHISGRRSLPIGESLRAFFGCPTALFCGMGYVAQVFVSYGYCAWGPKFVAEKFGLSVSQAGTGVMFWHYAASLVAVLAAGLVTDRLIGRWPRIRMILSMCAMILSVPALVVFGRCSHLVAVWAAAAVFGVTQGVQGANQFTAVFDVVPAACRSSSVGFLNVMAGLCGSLAPIMLGALSQRQGVEGFELGFSLMGTLQGVTVFAVAAACFVTFRKDQARQRRTESLRGMTI